MSRFKTTFLLVALIVMWGVSWPVYKITLNDTPPILFAGMRTFAGGLLMACVILFRYRQIHWKQNWLVYILSALFNSFLFYGLQTVGLSFMPEGLFTVIVYLQPVLIGVLAWIWLGEQLTVKKMIGLILGFGGVGVISITGISGHISVLGIVLALGTSVSWAVGTVYVKKNGAQVDPFWLVAFQCLIGGIVLCGIGLSVEHLSSITLNRSYIAGMLYAAIFGIAIAWAVFFILVRNGETSKVAAFTFLVPLLAVILGVWFLHESVNISLFIGLVLIVTSIYLVNTSGKDSKKVQNSQHYAHRAKT